MGESNTCCTWNVGTNGGKQESTVSELSYDANAGYRPLPYKCMKCTNEQAMESIGGKASRAGWVGKRDQFGNLY